MMLHIVNVLRIKSSCRVSPARDMTGMRVMGELHQGHFWSLSNAVHDLFVFWVRFGFVWVFNRYIWTMIDNNQGTTNRFSLFYRYLS